MSRAWTPKEDTYLIDNCAIDSDKELAFALNRGPTAVGVRLSDLRKAGRDVPNRNRGNHGGGNYWKPPGKYWDYGDVIPDHIRIT